MGLAGDDSASPSQKMNVGYDSATDEILALRLLLDTTV